MKKLGVFSRNLARKREKTRMRKNSFRKVFSCDFLEALHRVWGKHPNILAKHAEIGLRGLHPLFRPLSRTTRHCSLTVKVAHPTRLSRYLMITKTLAIMIVDQSHGLHERITDG